MRVCCFIATTEGPVRIQSITPEAPEVKSVVCLDGTPEPLPISRAYHHFVRTPTGVIERKFGHGAFRADVARRVDSGNSWQLAFYLAHHFHALDLLRDGPPQAGDVAVFATGLVDSRCNVGSVNDVQHKFRLCDEFCASEQLQGVELRYLCPAADSVLFAGGEVAGRMPTGVATVDEALASLPVEQSTPGPRRHRIRTTSSLAVLALSMLLGLAVVWNWRAQDKPDVDSVGDSAGAAQSSDREMPPSDPAPAAVLPEAPAVAVEAGDPAAVMLEMVLPADAEGKARHAGGAVAGRCEDSVARRSLVLGSEVLDGSRFCGAILHVAAGAAVLAYGLDSGKRVPIARGADGWWMPAPPRKGATRRFVFLVLDSVDADRANASVLPRLAVTRWEGREVNANLVLGWLEDLGWDGRVYVQEFSFE
jgi:hypothetical protein